MREQWGGEDEQVLSPLLGPQQEQHVEQQRSVLRICWDHKLFGQRANARRGGLHPVVAPISLAHFAGLSKKWAALGCFLELTQATTQMLYSGREMSRLTRFLFPFLLVAAIAAGCSKPEDKFVGHYTGKMVLSQKALAELDKAGPMASGLKEQLEKLTMDLELKADKTFSVTASGSTMGSGSTTGTWVLTDGAVVISPTSAASAGKQTAITGGQTQKFTASPDGKTLTADMSNNPMGAEAGSLVFTKN